MEVRVLPELHHTENESAICDQYEFLITKIAAHLQSEGAKVKAFRRDWHPSVDRILAIWPDFSRHYRAHSKIVNEGISFTDTKRFLWRFLKELGYVPPSDVFDAIRWDSVIEVYRADGKQIFRNLRFFEICSYTLDELYTYSFVELYRRDPKDLQIIQDISSVNKIPQKNLSTGGKIEPGLSQTKVLFTKMY